MSSSALEEFASPPSSAPPLPQYDVLLLPEDEDPAGFYDESYNSLTTTTTLAHQVYYHEVVVQPDEISIVEGEDKITVRAIRERLHEKLQLHLGNIPGIPLPTFWRRVDATRRDNGETAAFTTTDDEQRWFAVGGIGSHDNNKHTLQEVICQPASDEMILEDYRRRRRSLLVEDDAGDAAYLRFLDTVSRLTQRAQEFALSGGPHPSTVDKDDGDDYSRKRILRTAALEGFADDVRRIREWQSNLKLFGLHTHHRGESCAHHERQHTARCTRWLHECYRDMLERATLLEEGANENGRVEHHEPRVVPGRVGTLRAHYETQVVVPAIATRDKNDADDECDIPVVEEPAAASSATTAAVVEDAESRSSPTAFIQVNQDDDDTHKIFEEEDRVLTNNEQDQQQLAATPLNSDSPPAAARQAEESSLDEEEEIIVEASTGDGDGAGFCDNNTSGDGDEGGPARRPQPAEVLSGGGGGDFEREGDDSNPIIVSTSSGDPPAQWGSDDDEEGEEYSEPMGPNGDPPAQSAVHSQEIFFEEEEEDGPNSSGDPPAAHRRGQLATNPNRDSLRSVHSDLPAIWEEQAEDESVGSSGANRVEV